MNKNQLIKSLRRNKSAYENLPGYQSVLKEAVTIKMSLSHIQNLPSMSKQFDEFSRTNAIKFPFDNVFIDLHGYQMPSMLTGESEIQNMGIHLIPMTFDMKGISIVSLLVLDFRMYGNDVINRTYLIYCDMAGLHVMANVDKASKECECYLRNVFWMNPNFRGQIMSKIPCHINDTGLSLPDCSANALCCQQTIGQKNDIADLVRILLGYMTLPCNHIFKVINTESKKRPDDYFILADNKQLGMLIHGEGQAETSGNEFIDGSRFKETLGSIIDPVNKRFKINGKIYEYYPKEDSSGK